MGITRSSIAAARFCGQQQRVLGAAAGLCVVCVQIGAAAAAAAQQQSVLATERVGAVANNMAGD